MAEEFLDCAKIPAAVEKVGGKTVAQHVGMNSAKSCAHCGLTDGPVDRFDVQRMTAFGAAEIHGLQQFVALGLRLCPRHF